MKLSDAIKELDALLGRHGDGEFYAEVNGQVERVKLIDHDRFDSQTNTTAFVAMGDGIEV